MNRFSRYLLGTSAALLVAAMPGICADLLLDDFTDLLTSRNLWVNNSSSYMTASTANGSCTLENSSSQYSGEYAHDFGTNKPSVFTLSYILKSLQAETGRIAGAFFCRQPGSALNGYVLTKQDNYVVVYKMVNGSGNPVFQTDMSFDLLPDNNKLTVSKSGTTFHVFANDVFAGSFTDGSYDSGDLSLLLFTGVKAVFGTVQVTDAFTQGKKRTEFSDDFNGNNLKYWRTMSSGPTTPTFNEVDGKLKIAAGAGAAAWIYVDLELTDFSASVEVSHINGSLNSPYGIFLVGEDSKTQMATFAIIGDRKYAMWKLSDNAPITTTSNTKIRGSGQDIGMVLTDTLSIKKAVGSSSYEFLVNGEPLDNMSTLGFNIKAIGLFCQDNVELAFDNFYAKQEGQTSILWDNNKRISRNPSSSITQSHTFYDLRGRKRFSTAASTNRIQTRAAGVYVNRNGRNVVAKRGKIVVND